MTSKDKVTPKDRSTRTGTSPEAMDLQKLDPGTRQALARAIARLLLEQEERNQHLQHLREVKTR